jgi:protocatechuate 3,4-dioxygenase beta subunit
MHNDDRPVERILSRRASLALLRAAGTALLVSCVPKPSGSTASISTTAATRALGCVVRPEMTEGPYFVDDRLMRSDIRSDPADGSVKDGVPLQLALRVSQVSDDRCIPLTNALVDIWHCDALGVYSDVADPNFSTVGQKFLRGSQMTDETGTVQFLTIYPGWYPGRTVHIHFKIRTDAASGRGYEFTSQLFFDDTITDRVYTQSPYSSRRQRTQRNDRDGIFQRDGNQLLLMLNQTSQGYAATFDIGMQIG